MLALFAWDRSCTCGQPVCLEVLLWLQSYDKAKDEEDRWQETMAVNGGGKAEKPGLEHGNGNNGAVV